MLYNLHGVPVYQAADRDLNAMEVNTKLQMGNRCYNVA